ncbi:hypothetical protein ACFL1H_02800 [Nanoarchaeota archaeon]
MKRALAFIIIILTLLLSTSVLADFGLKIKPIKDVIVDTDSAKFNVTITNNFLEDTTFFLSSPDEELVVWDFYTDPLTDSTVEIPAGETYSTIIIFKPYFEVKDNMNARIVRVAVDASEMDIKKEKELTIFLGKNVVVGEYVPSYIVEASLDKFEVVPNVDDLILTVKLNNKNGRIIDNLKLIIESDLIDKNEQIVFLDSWEDKPVKFKFNFDPKQQPQEDEIKITAEVLSEGDIYLPINEITSLTYEIKGYSNLIQEDDNLPGFLKKTDIISIKNDGTLGELIELDIPSKMFTKKIFTVDPQSVDGNMYKWTLAPGQEINVRIVTNYRLFTLILVIIVLIIIGSIIAYYSLRSPLIVTKRAASITTEEGGIANIKFVLNVKNRTKYPLKNLELIDKLSKMVSLDKEMDLGSVKPSKVVKNRGTVLKWQFNVLDPFEERIITYKVKSKLKILGRLNVLPTKAKFIDWNNGKRITLSNDLDINV